MGIKSTEDDIFTPTNIGVTAGKIVRTGQGVLKRVVLNKPVASGTVTLYDGIDNTGTKIATITLPATLTSDLGMLDYDVGFATGLFVVTTGVGIDVTVVAR